MQCRSDWKKEEKIQKGIVKVKWSLMKWHVIVLLCNYNTCSFSIGALEILLDSVLLSRSIGLVYKQTFVVIFFKLSHFSVLINKIPIQLESSIFLSYL